jgi:hypothetical protein
MSGQDATEMAAEITALRACAGSLRDSLRRLASAENRDHTQGMIDFLEQFVAELEANLGSSPPAAP